MGDVEHRPILNVAAAADMDVMNVTTYDHMGPDGNVLIEVNVSNDQGGVGDIYPMPQVRQVTFKSDSAQVPPP